MKERARGLFAGRREQRKLRGEELKTLRQEVFQLIDQVYDAEPSWISEKRYHIASPTVDWKVNASYLLTFYPEVTDKALTSIFITKLDITKLNITLGFSLNPNWPVDLWIDIGVFKNKTEIKARFKLQSGPASFDSEKVNREGGIVGEIIRLNLTKEVLSTVLVCKKVAQTT